MLKKLNTTSSIYQVLPEVLTELCEYLNFGCGFYYKANYKNILSLQEYRALYPSYEIAETIKPMSILNEDELTKFKKEKFLFYRSGESGSDETAGEKLCKKFNIKSLILMPILNDEMDIAGIVGVSDRRGRARTEKDDLAFAQTIIGTICNYLNIQIIKEQLDSTENALQNITDNMGVDIYVNDFYTHEILYANSSMAEPYGGSEKLLGRPCWEALYDDKTEQCDYCPQKKIIGEDGNPTKIYSWDYQRPMDGKWFRVLSTAFRWTDGRLAHLVSSIDITESKKNEEIIQRMAMFDHLTGLPNRYTLNEDLEEMALLVDSNKTEGYVIFFDLTRFKNINDTYGHQTGDDLLVKIGELLQSYSYINEKCYRYGGDEFVILCYDNNIDRLDDILSYLTEIFSKPIEVDGKSLEYGASIGVSRYPSDDIKASSLVRKADQAMYVSKNTDKSMIHFYNKGDMLTFEEYSDRKLSGSD